MNFNINRLTSNDLHEFNEVIGRTAPKVRFWYLLQSTRTSSINEQAIIEQTKAVSDFDKLYAKYKFMHKDEYTTKRFLLSEATPKRRTLNRLIGFKNLELCLYNPSNPLAYISIGKKKAELIQIDGIGFGNTYEGRINFDRSYAVIKEEDQDLAHKFGLMFTPSGILEIDSLTPSDPEMNRGKSTLKDLVLYCDNRACQKEIRNPFLVVDDKTGGVYHSHICYLKDIKIKIYLGVDGCFPREVTLCEAQNMFRKELLQQSLNYKNDSPKLRSLEPWPEAAIV